jgi:hypothetical protein
MQKFRIVLFYFLSTVRRGEKIEEQFFPLLIDV